MAVTYPTSALELSRQYTSFSGVDIRVVIEGVSMGTVQGVSYAIQREKAPVYVMGRVDPLSFSRGKRGIAGTIISLMLDSHILKDEENAPFASMGVLLDNDELVADPDDLTDATPTLDDLRLIDDTSFDAGDLSDSYSIVAPNYIDQVPPFDIVLVAANEYGKAATMRMYGVEVLNEGSGFSIDDLIIEAQATIVLRTISPWQKLGDWSSGSFRSA